ncbi:MAG: flagellar biosynthetic protein FliR [Candidatus Adiutrix sp.]|jgi:flagellar biosynthetic protein FliR|nr:flagellar biosynthetic protein FliR [Candidatus Adiutrix sp.]
MGAPVINAAEFAAFVLVLLRLSMLVVFAPIFSGSQVMPQLKAALTLMLTFVIAPGVEYSPALMPMTWHGFLFLGLGEVFIGYALAFMVRVVLDAAKMAGEYVSFQMSLSMLNSMDPQGSAQIPMMGMLFNMIVTLFFLYANGHMLVLKAVIDSFKVAPPGLLSVWRPEMFTEALRAVAGMYILALKIAAPVLGVLFCVKVAFGIVAKAVPQMNILFVGMPVYIMVGFAILGYALPWWPGFIEEALVAADQAMGRILAVLAPAASDYRPGY